MNTTRVLLGEVVGTFTLLFVGVGAAVFAGDQLGLLGVALAFGLAVMMMAYTVGPVSGAHLNPAVSLSLLSAGKISPLHFGIAVVAQIVGAILGVSVVYMIASAQPDYAVAGGIAANSVATGFNVSVAIIAEMVATFLLCFVVLNTTNHNFPAGFGGLVAGLTLTAGIMVIGPITNAAINPTRALATAVYDTATMSELWIFVVGPFAGALLAAIVYKVVTSD